MTEHVNAEVKLTRACIVAFMLMCAEYVGGYLAGSLSVMSDATHMSADVMSFLVSLIAVKLSKRPPNILMPFGYKRAEVLGALASMIMLWLLTIFLVHHAITRIYAIITHDPYHHEAKVDGKMMCIVSAIALLVNLMMAMIVGHHHHHGHSHIQTDTKAEYMSTEHQVPACSGSADLNLRAAYLHIMGDLLQNIGVLIAGSFIWWRPSWHILDPILTLLFALIVFCTTFSVYRESLLILMECTPREISPSSVSSFLEKLPYVESIHALRIWSIGTNCNAISAHIVVTTGAAHGSVRGQATTLLQSKYSFQFTTIQVEDDHDPCHELAACHPIGHTSSCNHS